MVPVVLTVVALAVVLVAVDCPNRFAHPLDSALVVALVALAVVVAVVALALALLALVVVPVLDWP